ncbi:ABC transporter A family protein [Anopheles sinensis]|uniref:ABC transporter A family protein n=1 Tax=Anopheles sinensis TaxID=74873 RepID=A0A084VSP7_ANOSI|nr:ABC transporter A family protein [Anopheles sinensis]
MNQRTNERTQSERLGFRVGPTSRHSTLDNTTQPRDPAPDAAINHQAVTGRFQSRSDLATGRFARSLPSEFFEAKKETRIAIRHSTHGVCRPTTFR